MRRLSDAVMSRAIHGVPVPIFFQGEQIGERRYYNDRLAMFILRYRDPLRYGKWLDRQQQRGHPEGAPLEFAAAKREVREDADLSVEDPPERVAQRIEEIAAHVERMERALCKWDEWAKEANSGDMP